MEIKKIVIDKSFDLAYIQKIDSLLKTKNFSPIWQNSIWNNMLQESNNIGSGFFIGIFEKDELVNFVIIEKRSIGAGKYGNFVIGGPFGQEYLEILEKEIIDYGNSQRVIFTQLEPLENLEFKYFKIGYYKNFIEKFTNIIDLSLSEEEILSNMKPKGRYNIKIAQKNNIIVEKVSGNKENIEIFYNLMIETTSRDNFSGNSKKYYETMINFLEKNNYGGLYFAKMGDDVLSAGIWSFYGNTATYYYGASTSDNNKRKFMPAYLIQWELIRIAKNSGYKIYDFLGIADPDDKNSHLAGVTDFKLKFSDNIIKFPENKIYIHKKIVYFILKFLKTIKKYLKKN